MKREAEDWGRGEAAVTDGHKHLAQANYHIAQAEKHIAQQKKLIEKLERNGARHIDVAVSMLRALEVALRAFERHRGLIMKRRRMRNNEGQRVKPSTLRVTALIEPCLPSAP